MSNVQQRDFRSNRSQPGGNRGGRRGGQPQPQPGVQKPWGEGTSRNAVRRRNLRRAEELARLQTGNVPNQSWRRQRRNNPSTIPRNRQTRSAGVMRPDVLGPIQRDSQYARELAAKYVSAVFDPQNAQEDTKVIHGLVSSYPTSTIKIEFTGTVITNNSGSFGMQFVPWNALDNEVLFVYNSSSFTNTADWAGGHLQYHLLSDHLPTDKCEKRRVVCASLAFEYIGSSEDNSGQFVSAFLTGYKEEPKLIDLQESFFKRKSNTKSKPEIIWIPREDKDLDFLPNTEGHGTGTCAVIGYGLPKAAECISYTLTVLLEYIPTTSNKLATQTLSRAVPNVGKVISNTVATNQSYMISEQSDKNVNKSIFESVLDKTIDWGTTAAENVITSILEDFLAAF